MSSTPIGAQQKPKTIGPERPPCASQSCDRWFDGRNKPKRDCSREIGAEGSNFTDLLVDDYLYYVLDLREPG